MHVILLHYIFAKSEVSNWTTLRVLWKKEIKTEDVWTKTGKKVILVTKSYGISWPN